MRNLARRWSLAILLLVCGVVLGGATERPGREPFRPMERPAAEREVGRDRFERRVESPLASGTRITRTSSAEVKSKVEATLARIERGERDPHHNDGAVYRNYPHPETGAQLPVKGQGYYREYVYRPAGQREPGSERVVVGRNGEVYYTPSHYRSFQQFR